MKNDLSNTETAPVTELPESVRIPLHSLWADSEYLIGRVIADGSCGPMVVTSMRNRLDQIESACSQMVKALERIQSVTNGIDTSALCWIRLESVRNIATGTCFCVHTVRERQMSEYPRVHDCLYSWCPARRPECESCDAIKECLARSIRATTSRHPDDR